MNKQIRGDKKGMPDKGTQKYSGGDGGSGRKQSGESTGHPGNCTEAGNKRGKAAARSARIKLWAALTVK